MSMQRAELTSHPTQSCPSIRSFVVEADPATLPSTLVVVFRIAGDASRLHLPPTGYARRTDRLWQHSCFEAFLKAGTGASYYEFNFAPSGDWAAYRFGRPRSERSTPDMPTPRVECRSFPEGYELSATLPIAALPELARSSTIEAGIAAVIEAEDGTLSYWALAHGGPKPDFHDPASFRFRLSRP